MYIDLINASKELLDQGHTFTTPEIGLCAGALCSPNLFKQIKTTFNLKRLAVIYYFIRYVEKNNDLRLRALQCRYLGVYHLNAFVGLMHLLQRFRHEYLIK